MARSPASTYQRVKEFVSSRPGQYFTSEAVLDALKLKDPKERTRISKNLAALSKARGNGIARRQNDQGRYEYAYAGGQPPEPVASSPKSRPQATRERPKPSPPTAPKTQPNSVKKLANFIRAFIELAPEQQREAYAWLKEQIR